MERSVNEGCRRAFLHLSGHFHSCDELAHLDHHIIQSGIVYQHFLHKSAHIVHKAESVAAHRLRMVCDCLHLCLRYIVIAYQPHHQLPFRIVVERVVPRKVHLSAVRTFPQEEGAVLYLVP